MYVSDIINIYPSNLVVNSFAFTSYVYSESTNLSLSLTGVSSWPTLIYTLIINIPAGIDSTSAYCTSNIANLQCSFFNPTNTLTVSMSDSTHLPLNIIFSIDSLISPTYGTSTQSFTLTTFSIDSY